MDYFVGGFFYMNSDAMKVPVATTVYNVPATVDHQNPGAPMITTNLYGATATQSTQNVPAHRIRVARQNTSTIDPSNTAVIDYASINNSRNTDVLTHASNDSYIQENNPIVASAPTQVIPLRVLHVQPPHSQPPPQQQQKSVVAEATGHTAKNTAYSQSSTNPDGTPIPLEQLKQMLTNQLDYYFSRTNLANDAYLFSQMDQDMYVPIWTVANFNMVKKLTKDIKLITEVLRESPNVQVDDEGLKVRPNPKRCIIILREILENTPMEHVKKLFENDKCPKILSCEFAHNDSWYITFESDEDAQKALAYLRDDVKQFQDKPIKARIKTKPIMNRLHAAPPTSIKNGFRATPPPVVYDSQLYQAAPQRFIYAAPPSGGAVQSATPVPYNGQIHMFPFQQPFYHGIMPPTIQIQHGHTGSTTGPTYMDLYGSTTVASNSLYANSSNKSKSSGERFNSNNRNVGGLNSSNQSSRSIGGGGNNNSGNKRNEQYSSHHSNQHIYVQQQSSSSNNRGYSSGNKNNSNSNSTNQNHLSVSKTSIDKSINMPQQHQSNVSNTHQVYTMSSPNIVHSSQHNEDDHGNSSHHHSNQHHGLRSGNNSNRNSSNDQQNWSQRIRRGKRRDDGDNSSSNNYVINSRSTGGGSIYHTSSNNQIQLPGNKVYISNTGGYRESSGYYSVPNSNYVHYKSGNVDDHREHRERTNKIQGQPNDTRTSGACSNSAHSGNQSQSHHYGNQVSHYTGNVGQASGERDNRNNIGVGNNSMNLPLVGNLNTSGNTMITGNKIQPPQFDLEPAAFPPLPGVEQMPTTPIVPSNTSSSSVQSTHTASTTFAAGNSPNISKATNGASTVTTVLTNIPEIELVVGNEKSLSPSSHSSSSSQWSELLRTGSGTPTEKAGANNILNKNFKVKDVVSSTEDDVVENSCIDVMTNTLSNITVAEDTNHNNSLSTCNVATMTNSESEITVNNSNKQTDVGKNSKTVLPTASSNSTTSTHVSASMLSKITNSSSVALAESAKLSYAQVAQHSRIQNSKKTPTSSPTNSCKAELTDSPTSSNISLNVDVKTGIVNSLSSPTFENSTLTISTLVEGGKENLPKQQKQNKEITTFFTQTTNKQEGGNVEKETKIEHLKQAMGNNLNKNRNSNDNINTGMGGGKVIKEKRDITGEIGTVGFNIASSSNGNNTGTGGNRRSSGRNVQ